MSSKTFIAVLAATTMLAGGSAFADGQQTSGQQQATTPPPGHAAVVKDFGKLSKNGARAYQELTLARLAIFDGRAADAKKYVDDADSEFNKAKSDESVFHAGRGDYALAYDAEERRHERDRGCGRRQEWD